MQQVLDKQDLLVCVSEDDEIEVIAGWVQYAALPAHNSESNAEHMELSTHACAACAACA